MKKSILLLGSAGIAAGVALALATKNKQTGEGRARANDGSAKNDLETESSLIDSETDLAEFKPLDDEPAASMKNLESEQESEIGHIEIDDQGTDQPTAAAIIERVRDVAFDSSDERLALALGRPPEEVTGWLEGSEVIDGDVLLKVRALAMERGVEVPNATPAN